MFVCEYPSAKPSETLCSSSHLCTFSTVLSFMHFNAVLLIYVILCPSTLVIRICIFLSYRITNLYLCCYFTNFIDN